MKLQHSGSLGSNTHEGCDRRKFFQAREAFEYAYLILEPFLEPDAGWHGRSLHHVNFTIVSDNFPYLANEEVHALLDAIRRVFSERTETLAMAGVQAPTPKKT